MDYYAPWCSHCVKLHPTYEQIAQYFKYDSNLIIARFDATKNDVIGDWLRSYPTLLFYPLGNKCQINQDDCEGVEPLNYQGARDFETMKNWLLQNSQVLKNRPAAGESTVKEDL